MTTNEIKIPFNKPFIAGKELFYIAQAVIEITTLPATVPLRKMPAMA